MDRPIDSMRSSLKHQGGNVRVNSEARDPGRNTPVNDTASEPISTTSPPKGTDTIAAISLELTRFQAVHTDLARSYAQFKTDLDGKFDTIREEMTQITKITREMRSGMDEVVEEMDMLRARAKQFALQAVGDMDLRMNDLTPKPMSVLLSVDNERVDAAAGISESDRALEQTKIESKNDRGAQVSPPPMGTDGTSSSTPQKFPTYTRSIANAGQPAYRRARESDFSYSDSEDLRLNQKRRAAERLRLTTSRVIMKELPKRLLENLEDVKRDIDRHMEEGRIKRDGKRKRTTEEQVETYVAGNVETTDAPSSFGSEEERVCETAFTFGAADFKFARTPPTKGRVLVPDTDDSVNTEGAAAYATPSPSPLKRRKCMIWGSTAS